MKTVKELTMLTKRAHLTILQTYLEALKDVVNGFFMYVHMYCICRCRYIHVFIYIYNMHTTYMIL